MRGERRVDPASRAQASAASRTSTQSYLAASLRGKARKLPAPAHAQPGEGLKDLKKDMDALRHTVLGMREEMTQMSDGIAALLRRVEGARPAPPVEAAAPSKQAGLGAGKSSIRSPATVASPSADGGSRSPRKSPSPRRVHV